MSELKPVIPGYPCHKYIVRNINSSEGVDLFIREFLGTVITNKYIGNDYQLALNMLSALFTELPQDLLPYALDQISYDGDAYTKCVTLVGTTKLKKCTAYYKTFDKKTPCCNMCPICKYYCNSNEEHELSIVRYMLSSKEHFEELSRIVTPDFFSSVMDISVELPNQKGYVVPVLNELVTSSMKPNIRINLFSDEGFKDSDGNNYSAYDYIWEDALAHIVKRYKVSEYLTKNASWASVLKQIVLSRIMESPLIDDKGVISILSEIYEAPHNDFGVQTSMFEVIDSAKERAVNLDKISDSSVTDKSTPSTFSNVTSEDASMPDSNNNPSFYELQSDIADASDESSLSVLTEAVEEQPLSDGDINNSINEDVVENISIDVSNTDSTTSDSKEPVSESVANNKEGVDLRIYHKVDLITHVSLEKSFINEHFVTLAYKEELPQKAYDGFLNDKFLAIEVVECPDNTFAYIIWSRHTKEYYLLYADSINFQLASLLSRQMVVKVCHTPYYLYGTCKLYNRQIRNVFSLQTAHYRATGNKNVMSYSSLIECYENRPDRLQNVPSEIKASCIYLYGMPSYKGIHHVLSTMLEEVSDPMKIIMDRYVDESVGSSYFYRRNFLDYGKLMHLLPNGKFIYNEDFEDVPLKDGKYINYVISDTLDAYNFFRYLLYALSRDGHTRKLNYQLLGWRKNYISFFADSYCYDYFTTIINLYMYEYGTLFPNKKINIKQLVRDAKRISGDLSLSDKYNK